MCELPVELKPSHHPEFGKEPFETFADRVQVMLPEWPQCVLRQWLYENDRSPNYELSLDTFRRMSFTKTTVALKKLPDCSAMRHTGFQKIADGRYSEAHGCAAREAATKWPRMRGYSRSDLSDFVYLYGTWPAPIILADNTNGTKCFLGGESLKAPFHVLEGHHRLAWLLAMKNQGRAKPHHDVWIVRW